MRKRPSYARARCADTISAFSRYGTPPVTSLSPSTSSVCPPRAESCLVPIKFPIRIFRTFADSSDSRNTEQALSRKLGTRSMTSEHWSLFAGKPPMPVKPARGSRRVDIELIVDSAERAADRASGIADKDDGRRDGIQELKEGAGLLGENGRWRGNSGLLAARGFDETHGAASD
ncbi:uncharacterized protein SCHCODRAFT_02318842 [Schizophyllum commune H4-8]|uniref:uncharacterized protein n=1 Tax=Schizophyllum commune (strain H4-8 / FGSC 9210) TaxID=578458 RepID=UPI00215E866E|nr:uncharacterized protein SCHCODRAFT_02318842 [Schizophyllum commune H4-8]KAI5891405.1 hypothetical protein SCHCODRAFT_02318842 [Schizophyllum commune H4-8]